MGKSPESATPELRWMTQQTERNGVVEPYFVLQQKWLGADGFEEWKDVPIVVE